MLHTLPLRVRCQLITSSNNVLYFLLPLFFFWHFLLTLRYMVTKKRFNSFVRGFFYEKLVYRCVRICIRHQRWRLKKHLIRRQKPLSFLYNQVLNKNRRLAHRNWLHIGVAFAPQAKLLRELCILYLTFSG